jgi:RNA recognition motif-containing protein
LDQKEIQKGQIISVAISNPSKKATVADPKNLYVTNLPFSLIEQDVREMFAPYGDIKMIRLLTDPKSGSFKGTAFVDFLQEEAASTALHALNGSMIQGRAVVVSVADPNRKSQKIQQVLEVRNRKASQFKPIILSKQLSAHPKQKKLAISNTPKNSTESDKIEQPPKTQQDFRNLFNIK